MSLIFFSGGTRQMPRGFPDRLIASGGAYTTGVAGFPYISSLYLFKKTNSRHSERHGYIISFSRQRVICSRTSIGRYGVFRICNDPFGFYPVAC